MLLKTLLYSQENSYDKVERMKLKKLVSEGLRPLDFSIGNQNNQQQSY